MATLPSTRAPPRIGPLLNGHGRLLSEGSVAGPALTERGADHSAACGSRAASSLAASLVLKPDVTANMSKPVSSFECCSVVGTHVRLDGNRELRLWIPRDQDLRPSWPLPRAATPTLLVPPTMSPHIPLQPVACWNR